MKRFAISLGLVVASLWPSQADAQAWTRDAGDLYVNVGFRRISADRIYGPTGDTVRLGNTFAQHAISLYSELGLIDRWLMLTAEGELFRRNAIEDTGATSGLGDLRFGLYTGLLTAPFRLSAGVLIGVPTGDPSPSAPPPNDLTARTLPTGDGEVDVTFVLNAGHGFALGRRFAGFAQGQVGYALRNDQYRLRPLGMPNAPRNNISDQFVFRGEFGFKSTRSGWDRVWTIARLYGIETFGDEAAAEGATGLGDGVSYVAFGLEWLVDIHAGFGAGFGVEGALRATNLPAAPAYKVFLSYDLPDRHTTDLERAAEESTDDEPEERVFEPTFGDI